MPVTYKRMQYHNEIVMSRRSEVHKESIKQALFDHGGDVTDELQKVVSTGPRSGRLYFYRGAQYRASAPGEPPAERSGALANGFRYIARNFELVIGNEAFAETNNAPYPSFLEEGTSKMKPRSYFIITIERLHGRLQSNLGRLS